MTDLQLPWLEIMVLVPLVGALVISQIKDSSLARRWCLVFTGCTLALTLLAWQDFAAAQPTDAHGHRHLLPEIAGRPLLAIDRLSAPLLPLAALLYFLATLTTLRTKMRRFSFGWTLFSEGVILATLGSVEPWVIITLLAVGTVPPFIEMRARGRPTRVYVLHMLLFVALLVVGWTLVETEDGRHVHTLWSVVPLLGAVFIRSGIVPVHCWMTELFANATFGTALLFVTPIPGAYAAVRLVLPIAPEWVLRSIGLVSLVTSVYAAGMALVQTEARRYFCYLFLSHSALVLVGLEMVTPIGLTGALCVWISVGVAMAGFGLTMRALEARRGQLSLTNYQGLYEHTPTLAALFVLTGLAAVGFPGTLGFVGTELLVDGAIEKYPDVGVAVVLAAALNGISIVNAYFRLFTGTRHASSVSLSIGGREKFAVLTIAALILLGGLWPQFNVSRCHDAAEELLEQRKHSIGLRADNESEPRGVVTQATATEPAAKSVDAGK
jgi:NADH-quinone oxidoreductase subunit M